MNNNKDLLNIKALLDSLRANIGDSEFGYRVQALFAHVLLELGGTVTEVNQKGHPDIKSVMEGRTMRFQVKSINHRYAGCVLTISPNDIVGICPLCLDDAGYFAVLDCAVPVSWVVSEYSAIRRHEARSISIETIRASADSDLSYESTRAFTEILMRHKDNLHLLTFGILRRRALQGELL